MDEKARIMERCGERARIVNNALNHCRTEQELLATLEKMGYKKYEYNANDIWVNGVELAGKGICRLFILWQRCDEALEMRDEIDVHAGTIRVINMTHASCDAIEFLTPEVRQLIGRL